MKLLQVAVEKMNLWNKVLKALIPALLCLVALATLPEHNGSTLFIEKTVEKEKEPNKVEQEDIDDSFSEHQNLKKIKSKKKTIKIFSGTFLSLYTYIFTNSSNYVCINNSTGLRKKSHQLTFYIFCHQLVFYEG
jgi:hypothetical protein